MKQESGEAQTCESKSLHQYIKFNYWNNNTTAPTPPTPTTPPMCPELEAPTNGNIRVVGYDVGNVTFYSCNVNYQLDGRSTRTCGNDGQWSDEAPTCRRKE